MNFPAAQAQSLFVSENPAEFHTTADLDADGRDDIVIVDRATGAYRIGYQLSAGAYTWVEARASGVQNVTGVGVGNTILSNRPALAFTAPDANRVNLLDASSSSSAGTPVSVFIPSIGPNSVGVIDIGGGGNTPFEDLVVSSVLNGISPYRHTLERNTNGTNFGVITDAGFPALPTRMNRVIVRNTYPLLLSVMSRTAPTNDLTLLEFTTGAPVPKAVATNLPPGSDYVHARFSGATLSQFLFWQPGGTNLQLRSVTEGPPATFGFTVPATFSFGLPLRQVFVLPGPATNRLLIVFGAGENAAIYDFNGATTPLLVTNLAVPPGELITGAAMIGNNGVMLLSGAGGRSSGFHQYTASGATYSLVASGALPSVTPFSGGANVFQFRYEPFVNESPQLLRSLNAGDWSSQFAIVAGNVQAMAERFGGVSNGLRNPVLTALGPRHPLTTNGLVNQYATPVSIYGLTAANGDQVTEVKISPDPGNYSQSQQITFTPTPAGDQVWYRQGIGAAWTLYGSPFYIYSNTVISYYGKPASGNAKSSIRSAAYTFTDPTGTRDSDGDGVPDFVEIARGLDPEGGSDSDGDGWSDKDELLRGSDPNNSSSLPPSGTARLEDRNAFDYFPTPRPWDGNVNTNSLSATGTLARVYDMFGSLLDFGICTNVFTSGVTNPSAYISNIVFDPQQKLFVTGLDPHFDIITASSDKTIGRELLRLSAFPAITPVTVNYTYGGSNILVEATNWVLTASNAYRATPHVTNRADVTIYDTLAALLFEKSVGRILAARGTNWGTNITLFPHRASDVTRSNVPQELLLSLEMTTNGFPGYLLVPMWQKLDGAVRTNSNTNILALRAVAAEIYRLSSLSNNAAPATYPSPVDTLRQFVCDCAVESNYAAVFTLSGATRTNACTGVSNLLALAMPRPTTNISLRVRSDSFAVNSCTKLETVGFAFIKYLLDSGGNAFPFPAGFTMVAGTEVQVYGYTDVTNTACAGDAIEVITISMTGIPIVSDPDADGDLLLDTWELLFLDGLGEDAFADYDGDGWQNFQEMCEGSDPNDLYGVPPVAPVAMAPPTITITVDGFGNVRLQWSFAPQYVGKFIFNIREAASVTGPYTNAMIDVPHVSGAFDQTLPPAGSSHFYYVTMSLRPL